MDAISVSTTTEKYVISIDKKLVQEDFVLNLVERLRMESLAEAIDFDAEIEKAGNDIKADWWANNKERLLGSHK